MDQSMKAKILIVIAVMVAAVVSFTSIAVQIASLPDIPEWKGSGDWQACAEVASVSPEEAIRTASNGMGYSHLDLITRHAGVSPRYINETGTYVLKCAGGFSAEYPNIGYLTMAEPSYAWQVDFTHDGHLCMSTAYVTWHAKSLFSEDQARC